MKYISDLDRGHLKIDQNNLYKWPQYIDMGISS